MKKVVAQRNRIRTGDIVRIHVSLKGDMERARVSVWAAEVGYEFSPYVDPQIALITEKGRPHFAAPFKKILHEKATSHVFELKADCKMSVRLVQEVDALSDASPRVRIKRYGQVAQALGRLRNYFNWRGRGTHASPDGQERGRA
jgi:hypothetical protein